METVVGVVGRRFVASGRFCDVCSARFLRYHVGKWNVEKHRVQPEIHGITQGHIKTSFSESPPAGTGPADSRGPVLGGGGPPGRCGKRGSGCRWGKERCKWPEVIW